MVRQAMRSTHNACHKGYDMNDINKASIMDEIDRLKKKRDRLNGSLHGVVSLIDHLQKTVEHFNPKPKTRTRKSEDLKIDPDTLKGMTLADALVYLAEQNNGIVRNYVVRPILVEAGILRSKHPEHALSVALRNSEQFEPVSRGQFKLIEEDVSPFDDDQVEESDDQVDESDDQVDEFGRL